MVINTDLPLRELIPQMTRQPIAELRRGRTLARAVGDPRGPDPDCGVTMWREYRLG